MIDKVQTAKDGGLVVALLVGLFNSYVTNQNGKDEILEAETSARLETNVMNSLNNQANEDVNLQGGINRLEEDFSDLEKDFNTFVTEYWKNRSLQ
jgi:hypothetical protein